MTSTLSIKHNGSTQVIFLYDLTTNHLIFQNLFYSLGTSSIMYLWPLLAFCSKICLHWTVFACTHNCLDIFNITLWDKQTLMHSVYTLGNCTVRCNFCAHSLSDDVIEIKLLGFSKYDSILFSLSSRSYIISFILLCKDLIVIQWNNLL